MKKALLVLLPIYLLWPFTAYSTVLYSNSSTGNVGIGTASPSQPLTVYGNLDASNGSGYLTEIANAGTTGTTVNKLAKLSSGTAILAAATDTDGMIGIVVGNAGTTGNAQIAVSGQALCTFENATTAGDFVAIGSTTAGDCHDTGSSTRPTSGQVIGRVLTSGSSGTNQTVALGLAPSTLGGSVTGSGTANYVAKWSGSTALANSLIYDSGAQVGIGTSSPGASLQISHTLTAGTISSSGTTVTGSGTNFTSSLSAGDTIVAAGQEVTISSISNDTSLTTTAAFSPALSSGTAYQRVGVILNAGLVSIGTTLLPNIALYVKGLPDINGDNRGIAAFFDSTPMAAGVGGGIQFEGFSTSGGVVSEWAGIKSGKSNGTSGDYGAYMAFMTRTNGSATSEKMRIDSLGNVGIGTQSPSYTLHVNGSVAGTSAYNNLSDVRLKKDIEPIQYGLSTVMKLRPVSFNWKNPDQEWKKQHQIGLIAQEVEPVVPEVVTTAQDTMHTKSLAYGSLVPVLVKAVQDLQVEYNKQAAANELLRHEFEAYKKAHP